MGKYMQTVCRRGKIKERCETTLKKKQKTKRKSLLHTECSQWKCLQRGDLKVQWE